MGKLMQLQVQEHLRAIVTVMSEIDVRVMVKEVAGMVAEELEVVVGKLTAAMEGANEVAIKVKGLVDKVVKEGVK
jgi:hypothetical protein